MRKMVLWCDFRRYWSVRSCMGSQFWFIVRVLRGHSHIRVFSTSFGFHNINFWECPSLCIGFLSIRSSSICSIISSFYRSKSFHMLICINFHNPSTLSPLSPLSSILPALRKFSPHNSLSNFSCLKDCKKDSHGSLIVFWWRGQLARISFSMRNEETIAFRWLRGDFFRDHLLEEPRTFYKYLPLLIIR